MPSLPTEHMVSWNFYGVMVHFKAGGMIKGFGCSKEQHPI
jgi:hypothetical protein